MGAMTAVGACEGWIVIVTRSVAVSVLDDEEELPSSSVMMRRIWLTPSGSRTVGVAPDAICTPWAFVHT